MEWGAGAEVYLILHPFKNSKMMFSQSCTQRFAQNDAFCASFKRKITCLFFEHHTHANSEHHFPTRVSLLSQQWKTTQNENHTAAYSYFDLSTQQIPVAYPVSLSSVLLHSLDAILPHSLDFVLPHSRWIYFTTLSRLRSRSFSVALFSLTLSISATTLSLPQHNRLNMAC